MSAERSSRSDKAPVNPGPGLSEGNVSTCCGRSGQSDSCSPTIRTHQISASERLPPDWYVGPPELETDSDEVFVIGELTEPSLAETASDEDRETARRSRIQGFRETTRERRVKIAQEAEREFGRKVSWGARCGDVEVLFSHVTAPAMTHLAMRERRVLDTVVDAGLADRKSVV